MSLVIEGAGRVHVRIGGNTQETARMVQSLPDGKAIEKEKIDTHNPVGARLSPRVSNRVCPIFLYLLIGLKYLLPEKFGGWPTLISRL